MDSNFYNQPTLTDISSPRPPKEAIPTQIGPYKIESLVGKGGMSLLYLGVSAETKQLVAVKVLSPAFVTRPDMVDQFLKEAKIIAMASHPHIVKLCDQGQWEGGLYIAMEFIRGVSLKQFILQQSLSLKRCVDIILQVAYALFHLHSHGVIHGDLKPENILITEEGDVKVIDFGISRLHGEKNVTSQKPEKIAGTPHYMSPEQKESSANITYASDIYSLGIIAYELCMGKLSFGVIHPSFLPKGLRKIIEKALAVSVEERYQTVVAFISDLSSYLKSGGLEKDKPGSDQLKEMVEVIQRTSSNLSPSTLPRASDIEIGLAKYKPPFQTNAFFEIFRFSNQAYAIAIVETDQPEIDATIFLGNFRGMLRVLLLEKGESMQQPAILASTLNRLIKEDPLKQSFGFTYLLLNPQADTLSFVSCSLGGLLRLSQNSPSPHRLANQNPLLGVDLKSQFFEIRDRWDIGDTLLFHSLPITLEGHLVEALHENFLLSPQSQAEACLKKATSTTAFTGEKGPKFLLTIHRLG